MKQTLAFAKINYQIFRQYNLFVVKVNQSISYEDLIVHVGNLMADEQFVVGMNGLYDFSRIECLTGDVATFHSTAEAMNDRNIINKSAKTAIIIKEKHGEVFNAFYAYCQMTTPSLIDYQLFCQEEYKSAFNFLSIPHKIGISYLSPII